MGFEEYRCGWACIISRGSHCSPNICWTKWRLVWIKGQLLYADELLMAPTMEQHGYMWLNGEQAFLTKDLKVNAGNTKMMVGISGGKMIVYSGKWPSFHSMYKFDSHAVKWCAWWHVAGIKRVRGCRRCDGTIHEAALGEGLMVEGETYGCVKDFFVI